MSIPYRYVKGVAIGRDDTCALCGIRSTSLVIDHCHAHGFSRGMLCSGCNSYAGKLDRGAITPNPREAFYLANCPECRRTESIDSPDAHALRISAIALAISARLSLTPRQAGALALSLLHESESTESRDVESRESATIPTPGDVTPLLRRDATPQIRTLIQQGVTDSRTIRHHLASAGIAPPSTSYIRRLIRQAQSAIESANSTGYM